MKERLLAIVALTAILTGGVLWLVGEPGWADVAWGRRCGGRADPADRLTRRAVARCTEMSASMRSRWSRSSGRSCSANSWPPRSSR